MIYKTVLVPEHAVPTRVIQCDGSEPEVPQVPPWCAIQGTCEGMVALCLHLCSGVQNQALLMGKDQSTQVIP